MSAEKCVAHHICECQADRLARLLLENKKLRRENDRMSRQLGDIKEKQELIAAVKRAEEILAPFLGESE